MTRCFTLAALSLATLAALAAPASAQCRQAPPCKGPTYPVYPVDPQPAPPTSSFFLGVYTSTVPVALGGSPVDAGPVAQVVPGYGERAYGQRINRIIPNSPAFHAGLEEGDILLNANGIPCESDAHLKAAVAESGGYLELQVMDGRSGDVVWVVAEPDAQSVAPTAAPVVRTQQFRSQSSGQPRTQSPAPRLQSTGSRQLQIQSSPQGVGGRRAPVRRR